MYFVMDNDGSRGMKTLNEVAFDTLEEAETWADEEGYIDVTIFQFVKFL